MAYKKTTRDTVLLTPQNDEESLMIVRIAKAAGIPMVVSAQPHGARLGCEPDLLTRLRSASPAANHVVIVEIPGPEEEVQLRASGYDVQVIDHHRYDALDRMQAQSSLEQFLAVFGIDDARLHALGFDPQLVRGVGIIDRGFLWALRQEVADPTERRRMRDFYRSLTLALGKDRAAAEQAASEAWAARDEQDGIVVVKTAREDVSIRDAVSFLVADAYEAPPEVVVVEGKRRMFVQESDAAPQLFARYGGFTFGRDRCWGIQATNERPLPPIAEILRVLLP